MGDSIKAKKIILDNFRNFRDVELPLGRKITIISGQNGVGKSIVLSLIASGSGVGKKAALGSNFQPEFNEFFNIDPSENYTDYKIYIQYESEGRPDLVRRLSFQDYTKTERGIRIIPRTSNYGTEKKQKDIETEVKAAYGIGGAARASIPTIYLSLSRLYPLGEKSKDEKHKTSVSVKKISKRNALCQEDVKDKFRTWYNAVIPNAIKDDADIEIIEKTISPRASLHMDIVNTPTLSQSIGQDNVGNIISALVDIYQLSKEKDYEGALLCIDEIDVSLHPDTQIKMLHLLEALSDELNVQFVLSTHSLTFIKEMLQKENKNNIDYRVVYIKNPSAPYVSIQKDYKLLKADMFGDLSFSKPKVKAYFEDEVGKTVFGLLVDAFKSIYSEVNNKCKNNTAAAVLRNSVDEKDFEKINRQILDLEDIVMIRSQIEEIPVYLGCDTLADLNEADSYFKKVMIVLDGDARIKNANDPNLKPQIRDYLDKEYQLEQGKNERKHENNVCFLPDFFAPESFLYRIIFIVSNNAIKYGVFWKSVDTREETSLYTADKIKELFSKLTGNFDNDSLKQIFKKPSDHTEAWKFVCKTDIVKYYYYDYKTVKHLILFMQKVRNAYRMAYGNTNRY
ncbi:MAG: AAA family ATPase [bacterium]|nr:AAA family ATPase [bacterium]